MIEPAVRFSYLEGWLDRYWYPLLTKLRLADASPAVLVALFALSFAVPVIGAIYFSHRAINKSVERGFEELFPAAFSIDQENAQLRIGTPGVFDLSPAQDLLFSVWLKPKRLPDEGQSTLLFSTLASAHPAAAGIVLVLRREQAQIRPVVVINGGSDGGGKFAFPDPELVPATWTLFVVSFYQGRYLGLHTASYDQEGKPRLRLVGGYELEKPLYPRGTGVLQIGETTGRDSLRGLLGPVGVFKPLDLATRLKAILKELVENPLQIPDSLRRSDVLLWSVDGRSDGGPLTQPIESMATAKKQGKRGGAR